MSDRILFADDDPSFLEGMCFLLEEAGYPVERATGGREAFELLQRSRFPVMITDLRMPDLDGLDLLRKAQGLDPDLIIIMITALGDAAHAVEAMKAGAFDFLPKPCERDAFILTISRAMEHARLRRQVRELSRPAGSLGKQLIHASDGMADLLAMVDRVAASDATVLIEGESGTGKELVARRLHAASPRHAGPFVAINCGALPHELLESELFGHVRGAFTGATQDRPGRFRQAEGGTLLLDEIGEMPLDLQTRLLRVLQERVLEPVGADHSIPLDVRVVVASNRPLEAEVEAGRFRRDLYYRLNVVPLRVPPLRERPEDVLCLARHFLARHSGGREWRIHADAARRLCARPWPGNVRELENFCQRAALLSETCELDVGFLTEPGPAGPNVITTDDIQLPAEGISLLDLERAILVKALEMNQDNQSATARFLGIPRHILLYRMEKFGILAKGRAE
ncbi:MAG: sigma-54 dependent transcriptional regulator [bacterium]|jgi:two-component system NtrC family response regulator|nr:sigma-54 dependent transcriptional regulator [bacterium]